ncbi:hypothetical protein [Methanorbis rubei]|uniref:hypothetical protein n=1 Tax=Methanorbis rubei TaxID=3028300 RepID=UPI0030B8FF44
MCRVGFIDDEESLLEEYTRQFGRRGIELHFVRDCSTLEDVYNWAMDNRIQCFIVDYQLNKKYNFTGTELVSDMNMRLPHLPSIILTNYVEGSKEEKLVVNNLIVDRKKLDGTHDEEFFQDIKHACAVFETKLRIISDEYKKKMQKLNNKTITYNESERLKLLQTHLANYGEIDEVPLALLDQKMEEKLDSLLKDLKQLLENMGDETS